MLSKKAYPDAITAFNKALKFDKNNAEVYHYLGEAYTNSENDVGAIESFNKSIELNPKKSNSYASLSKIYDKQGNIDEAIISMKIAIELDPKNYSYYENIGEFFFKKSLINDAIEAYNKAIQLNPTDNALIRIVFSHHLAEHNLIDEAITQQELARKLIPGMLNYWPLSDLYLKKGDEKKAVEIFERAFSEDPTNLMDVKKYVDLLKTKNDIKKIEEILKKSANSYPSIRDNNPNITDDDERHDLGKLLIDYGCFDEAKQFFDISIQLYPDRDDFHILLGDVLLKMGLNDEAMAEFENIIRRDPSNYDNLYWISDIIRDRRSENIEAIVAGIQLFSKFESIRQSDEEIKNIMGLLYFDLGEYGLSIQKFMKAIFLTSQYGEVPPPYHTNLAEALTEAAEITEGDHGGFLTDWAISEYENALGVDTEYYDARLKLIELLQKESRNVEALNVCIEGLNQFPDDLSLHLFYAMELVKKGDIKQVLSLFQNEIKELDSAPFDLYKKFLEVLINKGYFKEAEKIARGPDNSFWNYQPPYDIFAKIFLHQGRFDEAISIIKQKIEKFKGSTGYFDLGEVYFLNSQFDDALECYRTHLKTDPKHFEAHKRMAEIFSKKGLIKEALIEYKAIIDLNPKDIEIYDDYKKLKLQEAEKATSDRKNEIQSKEADEKLMEFEKKIRKFLDSVLKKRYGNKYWDKIKFDKKEEIDQRIDDDLRHNPHQDKEEINPLDYFDIRDYEKIIRAEWSTFEEVFRSREEINWNINRIAPLRNSIKHTRPVSPAAITMGIGAIQWFDLVIDKWQEKI